MANEQVASAMFEFVKTHRPDIQAVDFFWRNPKTNRDELMSFQVGSDKPIPYEQCHVPLEARVAYFDQVHGFGANLIQKHNGKALLLLGPTHELYRLLQEIYRMRGIKSFKRLLEGSVTEKEYDALNMKHTQTVHFAMTQEVQQLISKDKAPTLEDIILFCIDNQAKTCAERNYSSYKRQVINVLRQAAREKILHATIEGKKALFKKLLPTNLFVSRCEDDPKVLYGLIDLMVSPERALEAFRQSVHQLMIKCDIFTSAEQNSINNKINAIPIHPMPKEVHVYTDGHSLEINLLDDLNREVNNEQDNEIEQESEQDTNLHNQMPMYRFEEYGWEGRIDLTSEAWLKFAKTTQTFFEKVDKCVEESMGPPPLFEARVLLKEAPEKPLQRIADNIDRRIWLSNNFLPRHVRHIGESAIEIGSKQQRDLYQVIVQLNVDDPNDPKVRSVGCLSMKDAKILRNKINYLGMESSAKEKNVVLIYDIYMRVPVASSREVDYKLLRSKLLPFETQLMYLNGDVNYNTEQSKCLEEWMPKEGAEAFDVIHGQKGKRLIAGTDMEMLIAKQNNLPLDMLL